VRRGSQVRAVAAIAALAMVTSCAKGGAADDAEPVTFDTPTPSASTSASAPPAAPVDPATVLPLTGAAGKDPAIRTRSALAAVLRFSPTGSPALGLDRADIVYQQPGKGSESRLVALYHSQDAAKVGPIGTTQPSDVALLSLVRPVYVHAGGADRFLRQLAGSGLAQLTPGSAGSAFTSVSGSFYGTTTTLRKVAPAGAGRPLQLLAYGDPGQPLAEASVTKISSVTVTVPGKPAQVWKRDAAGGWVQSGAGAPRVRVANLLIPQTVYRDLRADKAGTFVAEVNVFGKGPLSAVSGDQLVKGTWSRATKKSSANYADSSGVPLRLAPGVTWVLMAPAGTTVAGT